MKYVPMRGLFLGESTVRICTTSDETSDIPA